MSHFRASSRCECQAGLRATLDEKRHVLEGHAVLADRTLSAPAHSIGAELERFDIGWMCPFCGRNTLRSFLAGALPMVAEGNGAPKPAVA